MKIPQTGSARLDFDAIRATVKLRDVIAADLGPPMKSGRWACPFHGGRGPNFAVMPDGKRWRCWTCEATGDVLDYLVRRDNLTVIEAARRLDPSIGSATYKPTTPRPTPPPPPPAAWTTAEWQASAERIIVEAEAALWGNGGRRALAWLHDRGLAGHTIHRHRLGWIPDGHEDGPIRAGRGITIPWLRPGSWHATLDDRFGDPGPRWVGCNVRQLDRAFGDPTPKYRAFNGSERGHAFPRFELTPDLPCLVLEGEFDSLLAWQEASHRVNVLTVGGASQNARDDAADALVNCPALLLAFDHDANGTGDRAASKFAERFPHRCRRAVLPAGKDLTDYVRHGGDVLAWLGSEFDRLGWPR